MSPQIESPRLVGRPATQRRWHRRASHAERGRRPSGNLEKSFDQISQAMAHVVSQGVFPVVGGDHSIGFPTVRGLTPHVDGNVGIIHFDRHVDTQESDLDERMHTTPWFHATNIRNAPATNLVQIGIGGWQSPRAGVKVGRGGAPRLSRWAMSNALAWRKSPRWRWRWPGRTPRRSTSPSTST
nr:arginase family protein [Nonomuraea diastatica]